MLVKGVFKNVWNWSERGGQHFSNKSEIQKSLKYPIGGGGQAYLGKSPQFSRFLIMKAPLNKVFVQTNKQQWAIQKKCPGTGFVCGAMNYLVFLLFLLSKQLSELELPRLIELSFSSVTLEQFSSNSQPTLTNLIEKLDVAPKKSHHLQRVALDLSCTFSRIVQNKGLKESRCLKLEKNKINLQGLSKQWAT